MKNFELGNKVFKKLRKIGFFDKPKKKWKYVNNRIVMSKEYYNLFIQFLSNSNDFDGEHCYDSVEDVFNFFKMKDKTFLNDLKKQGQKFKSMIPYSIEPWVHREDYPLQKKMIRDIVDKYVSIDGTIKELNMDFEKGKVELYYENYSIMIDYIISAFNGFLEDKFWPDMYNDSAEDPNWIIEELKYDHYEFIDEYPFLAKLKHPEKYLKAFENYTKNCVLNSKNAYMCDKKLDELLFQLALDFMEDWFIPVNHGYK